MMSKEQKTEVIGSEIAPISLPLAKVLKSMGFNKPTEYFYRDKDLPFSSKGLGRTKNGKKMNHNKYDEFIYSAPSIKEAIVWIGKQKIT